MNRNFRHLFILLLFSGFSLHASAFNFKLKPNVKDAVGNGGNDDATEVKLPIGLPFQIADPSTASGGNEDGGVPTEQNSKIVYTFDLPDGQGPESKHETHSAFEQARSMNAACVLIRMSSMSSALDAAVNISDEISDYDRPVMVYVNDRAFSANTLISMAEDTKNANRQNKNKRQLAQIKNHVSVNSKNDFGGRNYSDDETNCTSGFSNVQLSKNQFSSGQNGDLDDVLTQAGLNNYTVVHYSPGFFAQVLDWCMKPYMSLILVLLIALGMRAQLTSAFPGPATFLLLVSLPLFAVPLFVGGLTGSAEFGSAIFLAFAFLISARKKIYGKSFRFILGLLFMLALTLCQSENFSQITNWSVPAITFLLTSATFLAGWLIPSSLGKLFRTTRSLTTAA